jgi:hypothetical protein
MANIARDTQVVRESVQLGTPNARVVQVLRESIILPIAPPNEDYWQNSIAPVAARLYQRLPLGDPEEIPAGSLRLGQPDEDYWQNPVAPVVARLYQRLPLGDPEEIPAGSLVPILPQPDEDSWQNPVAPLLAALWQRLPLGDPEEIPAGSLRLGQPDEDYWRNPVAPLLARLWQRLPLGAPEDLLLGPAARDTQLLRESIQLVSPHARVVQLFRESIFLPLPLPPDEDFWQNWVRPVVAGLWQRLPLGDPEEIPAGSLLRYTSLADKPSIQLHPLVKPLDFYTAPPKQPGRKSSRFTTLLTEAGASRAFSMPLGARNQPVAGKVFSFTMGGWIVPGAVGGTLIITPLYGATANGVSLGQSASQAYSASTTPIPWRLKGEIIFRAVDLRPGASLVVCSGSFTMNDLVVLFGSATPIQVDASANSASASGALNFAATFAPAILNVSPPRISTKYAFLRAI